MQHGPIYPNLYVYIIAESAKARKSTAMGFGQRMLLDAFPELRIFHDDMTSQGLIKYLYKRALHTEDKRPQGDFVIFSDELADLYGYDRGRAAKMVILLTRTFMCPDDYDHLTVRDSLERLYNLYPVMLAATDPTNLKVLPPDAIGGLTGRIIWITERKKRHINPGWVEEDTREELERRYLYECLIHDLQRVAELQGNIKVEKQAKGVYDEWYQKLSTKTTDDKNQDAFYHRCHTTALQVATLLSVSAGESLVICERHMGRAIELIEGQLEEIRKVTVWSGTGQFEQARARFITYLQSHGGRVVKKNLLTHMGLPIDEFQRVVDTLVEDGSITMPNMMNTQNGRVEVVTLTPKGMMDAKESLQQGQLPPRRG